MDVNWLGFTYLELPPLKNNFTKLNLKTRSLVHTAMNLLTAFLIKSAQ